MVPSNQQPKEWASGLVITTTCMSPDEKHKLTHDVASAGGRYSPNLSKRTTHLLTPGIVISMSQKLLAATADGRYPDLHVVSSTWLKVSMRHKKKADEGAYQPKMHHDLDGNSAPLIRPAAPSTASKRSGSATDTPATATAPQTPWVVHFSQMGDSIYGLPDAGSPTAHEHVVQKLQPIAESPSLVGCHSGIVTPAAVPQPVQQHYCQALLNTRYANAKTASKAALEAETAVVLSGGLAQYSNHRPTATSAMSAADLSTKPSFDCSVLCDRPHHEQLGGVQPTTPVSPAAAAAAAATKQEPPFACNTHSLSATPTASGLKATQQLHGPAAQHRPPSAHVDITTTTSSNVSGLRSSPPDLQPDVLAYGRSSRHQQSHKSSIAQHRSTSAPGTSAYRVETAPQQQHHYQGIDTEILLHSLLDADKSNMRLSAPGDHRGTSESPEPSRQGEVQCGRQQRRQEAAADAASGNSSTIAELLHAIRRKTASLEEQTADDAAAAARGLFLNAAVPSCSPTAYLQANSISCIDAVYLEDKQHGTSSAQFEQPCDTAACESSKLTTVLEARAGLTDAGHAAYSITNSGQGPSGALRTVTENNSSSESSNTTQHHAATRTGHGAKACSYGPEQQQKLQQESTAAAKDGSIDHLIAALRQVPCGTASPAAAAAASEAHRMPVLGQKPDHLQQQPDAAGDTEQLVRALQGVSTPAASKLMSSAGSATSAAADARAGGVDLQLQNLSAVDAASPCVDGSPVLEADGAATITTEPHAAVMKQVTQAVTTRSSSRTQSQPETPALSRFASVTDLVTALRAAATSIPHSTTAAAAAMAEAAALPLPQSQSGQQLLNPDMTAKPLSTTAAGMGFNSTYSVDELKAALQGATDETAADSAQEPAVSAALCAAEASSGADSLFESINSTEQLLAALRQATDSRRSTADLVVLPAATVSDPQQQLQQDVDDVDAMGQESFDELLKALRRATCDSRRGTTDLVAGDQGTSDQQYAASQVSQHPTNGLSVNDMNNDADPGCSSWFGRSGDIDALLSAVRHSIDSRRATAEAAYDPATSAVEEGHGCQQEDSCELAAGSSSSLDQLLQALRSATDDSRRSTTEFAVAALAGTGVQAPPAALAGTGVQAPPATVVNAQLLIAGAPEHEQQMYNGTTDVTDLVAALRGVRGTAVADMASPATCAAAAADAPIVAVQSSSSAVQDIPEQQQSSTSSWLAEPSEVLQNNDVTNSLCPQNPAMCQHKQVTADDTCVDIPGTAIDSMQQLVGALQRYAVDPGTKLHASLTAADSAAAEGEVASQQPPTCRSFTASRHADLAAKDISSSPPKSTGQGVSEQPSYSATVPTWSPGDTVAVTDPAIPLDVQQELQSALTRAGGSVIPGQPHLGCGANTIVTEPGRAHLYLLMLMNIVTPAWLIRACQQHPTQQLVQIAPEIARFLGNKLQQQNDTATGPLIKGMSRSVSRAGATSSRTSSTWQHECSDLLQGDDLARFALPMVVMPAASSSGAPAAISQQVPMARELLTDLTWSVDQDPRCVGDAEIEAVLYQEPMSLSLLLPQDGLGLLGHAIIRCQASEAATGLTCGDVLTTIHEFYQQEVLLQQQDSCTEAMSRDSGSQLQEQQRQQDHVMHRFELLGTRLLFEGLIRATNDPHSRLYEVVLA